MAAAHHPLAARYEARGDLLRALPGHLGHRQNVPYAYHAALAIAHGATWITNDLGNAQFPNLLWRNSIEN